jgi:hypothetical protein
MRTVFSITVMITALLAANAAQHSSTTNHVDRLLERPNLKGVASVHVESTTFIAVWTETPQDQTLEIYEMPKYPAVKLVSRFRDKDVPWQSLTGIQDGAVAGFQIRRTTGEGWFGSTLVYFYVNGKFEKVFESGSKAELLDLNGDGFPAALEYVGDKSDTSCKAKINIWKNERYNYFATVPLSQLFSPETKRRIKAFLKPEAKDR